MPKVVLKTGVHITAFAVSVISVVMVIGVNASYAQGTPEQKGESEQIPSWVKDIFVFYANGQISESELFNAIEYLAEIGAITITNDMSQNKNANFGKIQDLGDFYLTYRPNPNSAYSGDHTALAWLKNTGLLENEIEFLNENFRLPYDVEIITQECNEANAFYNLDNKQIVMCYQLINNIFETWYLFNEDNHDIDAANDYALDVTDYIFFHEVAHAIIDIYDLPTTGLEENVADQFASLIISYTYDEQTGDYSVGQDMLYNIGTYYLYEDEYWNVIYPLQLTDSGQSGDAIIPYWGEHGLDIQRFYNISCYAYGSDPDYNHNLIDEGWLPEERAVNCEWEYHKIQDSWSYLLSYFTNGFFD